MDSRVVRSSRMFCLSRRICRPSSRDTALFLSHVQDRVSSRVCGVFRVERVVLYVRVFDICDCSDVVS